MKTAKIPKAVEIYLDNNLLFNKFGIVNISAVKASTGCKVDSDELKKLIQARFGRLNLLVRRLSRFKIHIFHKFLPIF